MVFRFTTSYRVAVRIQILNTATHLLCRKGAAEACRYSIDLFGRPPVASFNCPNQNAPGSQGYPAIVIEFDA